MIRLYSGEEFRVVDLQHKLKFQYAVSNRGRIVSFLDTITSGKLLKGSTVCEYKILKYKIYTPEKIYNKHFFVHNLVSELFVPRLDEDQTYVLHLDHDRKNNHASNLKWANYAEKIAHYKKSPHVIRAKEELLAHNIKSDGRKLSVTNVIHLKKLINDPNRKTRLKILAKRFGISEMQLYRIKSGENWGHITV